MEKVLIIQFHRKEKMSVPELADFFCDDPELPETLGCGWVSKLIL